MFIRVRVSLNVEITGKWSEFKSKSSLIINVNLELTEYIIIAKPFLIVS